MNFFGLQIQAEETWDGLAEAFLKKTDGKDLQCKTLEVLDVLDLGSFNYLRCRTDLVYDGLLDVVNEFHAEGRNVILPGGVGGYVCKMKGRTGIVAYTKMQLVSRAHSRVYRGNAIAHWERQFLKAG